MCFLGGAPDTFPGNKPVMASSGMGRQQTNTLRRSCCCYQPCGPVLSASFWADVSVLITLAWGNLKAQHYMEAVFAVAMQCISSYTSYKALKACTLVIAAALGSGALSVTSAASACIAWYCGTGILLSLAAFLGERQSLHWRQSAASTLHAEYGRHGALYKIALVASPVPAGPSAKRACVPCTSPSTSVQGLDNAEQRMTADLTQCCQIGAQLLSGLYTNPYAASSTVVSMALSLADVGAAAPTALLLCLAWAAVCCVAMSVLDGWVAKRTAFSSASSGHLRYSVARALRQATEVFMLRGGTADASRIKRILAHNITQRMWQYVAELAQAIWYGFQAAYPAVMSLAVVAFMAWQGDISAVPGTKSSMLNATVVHTLHRGAPQAFRVPVYSTAQPGEQSTGLTVEAIGLAAAAVMTLMYALTSIPGLLDSLGGLAGRLARVAELQRALADLNCNHPDTTKPDSSESTALLCATEPAPACVRRQQALGAGELLVVRGLTLLCPVAANSNPSAAAPMGPLSAHAPARVLCSDVSLTLRRGRRELVQGPTGSGKSTLVRTLLGLHSPQADSERTANGSITWNTDARVFVVPQHPFIPLGCSLRALLMFPSAAPHTNGTQNTGDDLLRPAIRPHTDSDLVRLLLWFDLGHFLEEGARQPMEPPSTWLASLQSAACMKAALCMHPNVHGTARLRQCLDTYSADWHLVLSPGESQRIAIIRLLLHTPSVAVLDEATSALDDAMQGRVMAAVAGTGAAVLSVGHRGSLAQWHHCTHQLTQGGLQEVQHTVVQQEQAITASVPVPLRLSSSARAPRASHGTPPDQSRRGPGAPLGGPGGCCNFAKHLHALLATGFPRWRDPISALGVAVVAVSVALAWLTVRSALKYADVYAAVVAREWTSVADALLWASVIYVGAALAGAAARFLGKLIAVLWFKRLVCRLVDLLFGQAAVLRLQISPDAQQRDLVSRSGMGACASLNGSAVELSTSAGGAAGQATPPDRSEAGGGESITAPLIPHTPAVAMGPIARGAPGSSHGGGAAQVQGGAAAGPLDQRLLADAYSATHQIGLLLFGAENRIALLTVLATIGTSTAAAAALSPWAVKAAWAFGAAVTAVSLVAVRPISAAVYSLRAAEGQLREQHSHLRAASASVALSGGGVAAAASLDAALGAVVTQGMHLARVRLPAVAWERTVALGGTGVAYSLAAVAWEGGRVVEGVHVSGVAALYLLSGLLTSLLLYLCALPDYATLSADAAGLVSRVGELLLHLQGVEGGATHVHTKGLHSSAAVQGGGLLGCVGLGVAHSVGAAPLLHNVNFTLDRGRRVLVQGPTGSGKSTLVRTLAGATPPAYGVIQCREGRLLHGHQHMMVLAQAPVMFHGTLEELLLFPTPAPGKVSQNASGPTPPAGADSADFLPIPAGSLPSPQHLLGLLAQFDLLEACERACGVAEGGLAASEGGVQYEADWHLVLSPGEAQRIAIIRLLLHTPSVAVLDEATSALDDAMQGRVMAAVAGTGAAVLSVGHRGSLAQWHDSVVNTTQWQ